ncbi:hypothetical protein pb186bvf_017486 [Paramecium bursaria]
MKGTSEGQNNRQLDSIKNAKYKMQQITSLSNSNWINTGEISNNLKYIAAGGQILKIWKFQTNNLMKCIKFDNSVVICRFTDDSHFLYVGAHQQKYQFQVNKSFKKLCKYVIPGDQIKNIRCVTNNIILMSSHSNIIKTDFILKQQLFKIQLLAEVIISFDYNQSLDMIAIGGDNELIKLWNGKDGLLLLERLNEVLSTDDDLFISHNNTIEQVLLTDDNQLISLDHVGQIIIWKIICKSQLVQLNVFFSPGFNISLALQQQYIIIIGNKYISFYTISGDFIRQIYNQFDFLRPFKTTQHDSMKVILIQGICNNNLFIYQFKYKFVNQKWIQKNEKIHILPQKYYNIIQIINPFSLFIFDNQIYSNNLIKYYHSQNYKNLIISSKTYLCFMKVIFIKFGIFILFKQSNSELVEQKQNQSYDNLQRQNIEMFRHKDINIKQKLIQTYL